MSKSTEEKLKLENLTEVKSSPLDILGIDYSNYRQSIYSLSISKPSDYFTMRQNISTALTEDIISSIYTRIYSLLREGKVGGVSVTGDRWVGYPSNKTNEMALSVSCSLERFLNDCIEIVLPQNYLSLAGDKMIAQTNAI